MHGLKAHLQRGGGRSSPLDSRGTAYALVKTGQLRSVAVGRRRLIPGSEIERFLASIGAPSVRLDSGVASPSTAVGAA